MIFLKNGFSRGVVQFHQQTCHIICRKSFSKIPITSLNKTNPPKDFQNYMATQVKPEAIISGKAIKKDWLVNKIHSIKTSKGLSRIVDENQSLLNMNHYIKILDKESEFITQRYNLANIQLSSTNGDLTHDKDSERVDTQFFIATFMHCLDGIQKMSPRQVESFIDLGLNLKISDVELKQKLLSRFLGLSDSSFAKNFSMYLKLINKFLIKRNWVNGLEKDVYDLVYGKAQKFWNRNWLSSYDNKLGFLQNNYAVFVYTYSQNYNHFISKYSELDQNELDHLCKELLINIDKLDSQNLIMGLGGLGYYKKLLQIQENPETKLPPKIQEKIDGIDEMIYQVRNTLISLHFPKEGTETYTNQNNINQQIHSNIFKVCSQLELKDELLLKGFINELKDLAATEKNLNRKVFSKR